MKKTIVITIAAALAAFAAFIIAAGTSDEVRLLATTASIVGTVGGTGWVLMRIITLALEIRREDRRTRANLTAAQAARLAAGERNPSQDHRPPRTCPRP
ncbi:hypothetical protein AB0F17_34715 [Nonomuraea sp. NPDC026600]|uniref:hypothetical protein n=1 Tax=Nonomuraea sp. NPDC026600 TaxID=3155363 RepID=UPI0033D310CB